MMYSQTPSSEQMSTQGRDRRSFLGFLFAAIGGLVGAALAIPVVRFAAFPLRRQAEEASWSDAGKVEEFLSLATPVARTIDVKTIDGWRSTVMQTGIYVLPAKDGNPRVLSSVCPHLGCSVRWIANQDKFICPCHGGTFTADGVHISGPPQRAMDELQTKVEDGVLKVRFQLFRQLLSTKEPVG